MKWISTRRNSPPVGFREAVLSGLAPDGGLYVPSELPKIEPANIHKTCTPGELGVEVMSAFLQGEFERQMLEAIMAEVLDFPMPVIEVEQNIYALELFHGPTLAFKDVGARFLGRILPYCRVDDNKEVTVLVATSGDTGGAVANGLYGVHGVHVVVLYPEGRVSPLQERQFASLGGNVTAIRVSGVFDDCQRLVKQAFADEDLRALNLTTANSINVARWLPQSIYYWWLWKSFGRDHVISVPSGNFGNLTAGILAAHCGMPVTRFIAACNVNDTVPRYLFSGKYDPRPSVATVANAMDVGDPSNFDRMTYLYNADHARLKSEVEGAKYADKQIVGAIEECLASHHYLLDPHGACGYLALKDRLGPGENGIFLATAHPAKFSDVYSNAGMREPQHPTLEALRNRDILSTSIGASLQELKAIIL